MSSQGPLVLRSLPTSDAVFGTITHSTTVRASNALHHPRPRATYMRGTLQGGRVHAVVRCCGLVYHPTLITFLSEEDFGDVVNLFVERLDFAYGVVERDADHTASAQGDHLAPMLFEHKLESLDAEARGEHTVEGGG